jgi:hypothetical protein
VISTTQHTLGKKVLLATAATANNIPEQQSQQLQHNSLEGGRSIWLQVQQQQQQDQGVASSSSADESSEQLDSFCPSDLELESGGSGSGGSSGIRALSATSGRFVTLPQRTTTGGGAAILQQQARTQLVAAAENNGGDGVDLEEGLMMVPPLELENNSSSETNFLTSDETFHN